MFERHFEKFRMINELTHSYFTEHCNDDCASCPIALHIANSSHRCTYGMSEMEFSCIVAVADCEY